MQMLTTRPTEVARLARTFHALSDETRLRLVLMLARREQCVCDLQAVLGAAQSRLSFHLRVLKDAELVVDRREGRWVHYSLAPGALEWLRSWLDDLGPGPSPEAGAGCCR